MMELFTLWEMEGRGDEASVTDISELTKKLALIVISAAGTFLLDGLMSADLSGNSLWNEAHLEG